MSVPSIDATELCTYTSLSQRSNFYLSYINIKNEKWFKILFYFGCLTIDWKPGKYQSKYYNAVASVGWLEGVDRLTNSWPDSFLVIWQHGVWKWNNCKFRYCNFEEILQAHIYKLCLPALRRISALGKLRPNMLFFPWWTRGKNVDLSSNYINF